MGLASGSFANVCIVRLPAGGSLWTPRSRCPACGSGIRAVDNIPLLSFMALKGHCRSCAAHISVQYPLVEGAMALLFLLNAVYFRSDLMRLVGADILAFYFLTLSIIDYQHRIIPDELSLSLLILGLCLSFFNPYLGHTGLHGFFKSLISALGTGLAMLLMAWLGEKIFKKEALGGGDVKLEAAVGATLGWEGAFGSLFLGSLIGAMVAIALMISGKKKRGDTLPFGPFLSFGAYAICFLPQTWFRFLFA